MTELRVLALTDDAPTRALLTRMLAGRDPVIASDPASAIEAASNAPPDLVFIDVSAFGGAALALVHHVKALAPDASIHALTTAEGLASAAAAVALGGAGVLVLPLEGDEVLTAITDAESRMQDRDDREQLRRASGAADRLLVAAREVAELSTVPDRSPRAALEVRVRLPSPRQAGRRGGRVPRDAVIPPSCHWGWLTAQWRLPPTSCACPAPRCWWTATT